MLLSSSSPKAASRSRCLWPCLDVPMLIMVLGFVCLVTSTQAFQLPPSVSRRSLAHSLVVRSSSKESGTEQDPKQQSSVPSSTGTAVSANAATDIDSSDLIGRIQSELRETYECLSLALEPYFQSDEQRTAAEYQEQIVLLSDEIDALAGSPAYLNNADRLFTEAIELRRTALKSRRYELLVKMMRSDYDAYVATASFLGTRLARHELPNVQDVPYSGLEKPQLSAEAVAEDPGLVPDSTLPNLQYQDSPLDKLLLKIFRNLVVENTGGVTSAKPGIEGLLEQGRTFMLQPDQTSDAQHKMVRDTLGGLMTPVLPLFYRIFMSGIVPQADFIAEQYRGKQIGPWFYAPFLTSFVTPTFFAFLVGPSRINRRKDGSPGGLLVEKCKFLQESGCKGLCLHQCKLPAQQFFSDELGLPLTVSPNFETQECQWSFGEQAKPVQEDKSFPKGCLVGCESRKLVKEMGGKADICSV